MMLRMNIYAFNMLKTSHFQVIIKQKDERRDSFMKKPAKLLIPILASAVFATTASVLADGLPIFGKPKAEDVKQVKIEHLDYPNDIKEFTDNKNIELAVSLLSYLHTSPIKKITDNPPKINITYNLKDGSCITVSANSSTVWLNGRPRAIHDKNTFYKMCTAAFFFQNGNKG